MLVRGAIAWSGLLGHFQSPANSLAQSMRLLQTNSKARIIHTNSFVLVRTFNRPSSVATTLNWRLGQKHSIRLNHNGSPFLRPYVDPKLSYSFGRSQEHLIYTTIGQQLDKRIELDPDGIAYVSHLEGKRKSLSQLKEDVNRIAKCLLVEFGIKKGDFVGVFAYNCYNWIAIQFACNYIGAVLAPINPSYKTLELAYILKRGHVKCLFMPGPKSVQNELNKHLDILQSDEIVALSRAGQIELKNVIMMDEENDYSFHYGTPCPEEKSAVPVKLTDCKMHNWTVVQNDGRLFRSLVEAEEAGVCESEACIFDPDSVSPDDLFAVYYTSGTTGNPKGACISHFSVLNNVRFVQKRIRAGRPDHWKSVSVTCLPMFHIFAGVLNTLSPIVANTQIVYPSYKYCMDQFVEAMIENKANFTAVTPTMLIDLLTYAELKGIQNELPLRVIQAGGAAILPEVVARAFKVLPGLEELRLGYGATENSSVVSLQSIYDPSELRPRTVGPVLDLLEVRIVKPNTEDLVPLGERGEIQVRGFNTMVGYLDEPEKTAETINMSRWYKTGDLALMHPYGSIEICGRIKHMIIKGGENIYPEEVQKIILRLDYVEDVHVVGVPDQRFGEQVCAWIKLKPGYKGDNGDGIQTSYVNDEIEGDRMLKVVNRDDIINYCKDNITYFKIPKYILFVNQYPMTPTKKVQNHIISEKSVEIFKLHDQISAK